MKKLFFSSSLLCLGVFVNHAIAQTDTLTPEYLPVTITVENQNSPLNHHIFVGVDGSSESYYLADSLLKALWRGFDKKPKTYLPGGITGKFSDFHWLHPVKDNRVYPFNGEYTVDYTGPTISAELMQLLQQGIADPLTEYFYKKNEKTFVTAKGKQLVNEYSDMLMDEAVQSYQEQGDSVLFVPIPRSRTFGLMLKEIYVNPVVKQMQDLSSSKKPIICMGQISIIEYLQLKGVPGTYYKITDPETLETMSFYTELIDFYINLITKR